MKHITAIIYHQLFSPLTTERQWNDIRCNNCGRLLMRATGRTMTFMNARGLPVEEIPLGVAAVEHKCHSCGTMYSILWQ